MEAPGEHELATVLRDVERALPPGSPLRGRVAAAFAHLTGLAYADALTGLANRRALEERLDDAVPDALAAGRPLTLLICDVDELKELNDGAGHAVGDAALVRVATVLREVTAGRRALACRLGGDEFCVLLEDGGVDAARVLAEQALERLAGGPAPTVGLSCGVAGLTGGPTRPADLLRAADAALYGAKRTGRGRVCVADHDPEHTWRAARGRRGGGRRAGAPDEPADGAVDPGALVEAAMAALDGPLARMPALDRLEAVVTAAGTALDLSAGAISFVARGSAWVESVLTIDMRTGTLAGPRCGTAGERYALDEFPATRRLLADGGALLVRADDPRADAAERELLDQFGMRDLLACAAPEDRGDWLVELFGDETSAPQAGAAAVVRLLVAEAVTGARRPVVRLKASA